MWADVRAAFAFLTILPVGYPAGRKAGWAFAAFPLVGLAVGAVIALVASGAFLPPGLTAFLTLLAWVVITGGLHLDGLGDSCDGLLATVEPARRLEIMKDPRAGSWAVVGIGLVLLGKWASLTGLPPALLLLPPVIGRWTTALAAYGFPYARASGLGGFFRDGLGRTQVGIASLIGLGSVLAISLIVQPRALAVLLVIPLALLIARWAAVRLGGGLTGDVYGALCELSELLVLIVLNGMLYG